MTHTGLWKWLADAARCRDVLRRAMSQKTKTKKSQNQHGIPPSKLNVTVTDSAARARELKFVADLEKHGQRNEIESRCYAS